MTIKRDASSQEKLADLVALFFYDQVPVLSAGKLRRYLPQSPETRQRVEPCWQFCPCCKRPNRLTSSLSSDHSALTRNDDSFVRLCRANGFVSAPYTPDDELGASDTAARLQSWVLSAYCLSARSLRELIHIFCAELRSYWTKRSKELDDELSHGHSPVQSQWPVGL